ncbi:alcohol dehydrogenase catalytic domain-containing protein, partial [Umezawaea endophytica]
MLTAVVTSPEELAVVQAPEPVPGPGQVLIDVDAVGVGYVDLMSRRGEYFNFPGAGATPGIEVVGRVATTGPGTPETLVGQRFLALLTTFGGYAEKVVANADRLLLAPDGLSGDDVAALGLNALVAESALHRAEVTAGDRVLILGAGGGIGVLATQIAHARQAEVTVVTSSADRGDRLRA